MEPLIDSYGRTHTYLRLSVTDRCNLRCVYCMPPEGILRKDREEILSFEEIFRLTGLFADMGIRKVRLTGGEPLLRCGVERLVACIAAVPGIETVGMTTNGVLLKDHLEALQKAGLKLLNISLDTLRPERFGDITLRQNFSQVLEGLEAALKLGFAPVKLNVVVIRGANADELLDFVEFVRDRPVSVRFIEYMPFRANNWRQDRFMPFREMKSVIEEKYPLVPLDNPDDPSRVAREFSIQGFRGSVGFITSISEHFCGNCNRLRLSADGCMQLCLHNPGELNLRHLLRAGCPDEEIARLLRNALAAKPYEHHALESPCGGRDRTMIEIGG